MVAIMGERVSWSLNKPVIEHKTADVSFPDRYALHNNYPNPFNPITNIAYELPEDAKVSLVVYDMMGREVVRLVDGVVPAGYRQVLWNGKDHSGNPVTSGVYIYTIKTNQFTQSKKMVLMK